MKTGRTYPDFLTKLKDDKFSKRDFIGDTRQMAVDVKTDAPYNLALVMPRTEADVAAGAQVPEKYDFTRHALQQVCTALKIPFKYAQRLYSTHPDLLAFQINAFFSREPATRMIRTLDDSARAYLSDRYRILDNFDVAATVIPIVSKLMGSGWQGCMKSCEVTENRMYIKMVHPEMQATIGFPEGAEMGKGHHFFKRVRAGIVITNSEIGLGRVGISPSIYTEECTNLAIFQKDSYSKFHLGRKQGEGSEVHELFSDETRSLEDAATMAKIADVTKASLDGTLFRKHVAQLTDARAEKIAINPVEAVARLSDKKGLSEVEADAILNNLIEGGELNKFALHNAVTRAAEDQADYDRATDLEKLGAEIIELPKSDWQVLAVNRKAA